MNNPLSWILAVLIGVLAIRNYHEIEVRFLRWLVEPTATVQPYIDMHKGGRR